MVLICIMVLDSNIGIQMKNWEELKELSKPFMMISDWKQSLWFI